MTRDDDLFADALELPTNQRAAFLDRACAGDAEQRARIAALLAGHEAAEQFLERPATPRPVLPPEPVAGDRLGRYTLVRQIGEGGWGTVWLAEQTEPLRRLVALKVIKLGMDTRSVIARFEAERQALARMAHPDIAQVFDAGTTALGRPYFVMEYVEGIPITRFCDEHRLPLSARLELFARVCQALQHAHQKGIIHRDLKPSNILVTMRDGLPSPKVIDFGIAKATQGRLTDQTLFTELGQFIGTPAYMSPEQAELRDLDIDTRSDIYSLGVLLYELLTGRPPYDPKSLVQAGLLEIRRIIREDDPPRPSTVIGTLTDADRATVAQLRGAAAPQLTSVLRGDLDWIVMRCLEKERDRRYGTASDLAEDIRRHLRQEPVVARPPQALYLARKFVSRHRAACAGVAAVALALIGGTIISLWQATRAVRAERIAAAERDVAQAAEHAESLARADAQRRQEQAEDLLAFMLGDFRPELQKIGQLNLLDRVGEKALAYFDGLDPRDLTDTALTRQAKALTQLGEIRMDQARYPDAAASFLSAHNRAAALASRHPENADMLFERAQAEFWIGFIGRRRGDTRAEREWLTRYRESALALAQLEPGSLRAQLEVIYGHHNLAVIEIDRGSLHEAQHGFAAERDALDALMASEPTNSIVVSSRADVTSWLGSVAERDGRFADAQRLYAEMTARYEALHKSESHAAPWKLEMGQSLTFRARLAAVSGNAADAERLLRESRRWHDDLVAQDPKNKQWLAAAQVPRLTTAAILIARGAEPEAEALLNSSLAQLEELVAVEPSSLTFRSVLATALRLRAGLHYSKHEVTDATRDLARAIAITEALIQDPHADAWVTYEFAQAHLLSGRIVKETSGNPSAAEKHWQRARDAAVAKTPESNDWRLLEPTAMALTLLGHVDDARPLRDRLQSFGFRPIDPWARSLLGLGDSSPPARTP